MPSYKVLIVQVDNTELSDPTELALAAGNITFDNTSNGFTATTVQEAILEAATGSVTLDNFSYRVVDNKTVTIPLDQQMFVHQQLSITGTGDLIISGELLLFTER